VDRADHEAAGRGVRRLNGPDRYARRLRGAVSGRTVLLTGASSGIGRAFAHQLAEAGARLILVARDAARLERTLAEVRALGATAVAIRADLADPAEVRGLVAELERGAETVDVLVNNAGLSIRRPVERSLDRPEDFERLLSVNYLGPLRLVLALLPGMLERGRGHIVDVSTIGVQTGAPNFSGYVASKAALDHFARALMLELGRRPIRITTVHMPLVRTPMIEATAVYEAFPALAAQQAARRIGRALIRRPVRISPRWSTLLELLHAVAPETVRRTFALLHDPVHRVLARRAQARRQRSHRPGAQEEH
jgi:NAD(P)-dependent dehydrogenase (short-subunit alcohol dehydrogenase family)